jgi:hypothetical protein
LQTWCGPKIQQKKQRSCWNGKDLKDYEQQSNRIQRRPCRILGHSGWSRSHCAVCTTHPGLCAHASSRTHRPHSVWTARWWAAHTVSSLSLGRSHTPQTDLASLASRRGF